MKLDGIDELPEDWQHATAVLRGDDNNRILFEGSAPMSTIQQAPPNALHEFIDRIPARWPLKHV